MKVIAYGDVMDRGTTVFTSAAKIDGSKLLVSFEGTIRVDNPYKFLETYLTELKTILPNYSINETHLFFNELEFCNSNGFYVIMDLIELIYSHSSGPVEIIRVLTDDWQQETLPILIDLDEPEIKNRTTFTNITEL